MEELLKMLQACFPVAPELQVNLLNCMQKKEYANNKMVLRIGDTCEHLAFIVKGLVKIYSVIDGGEERIIWFNKENDVIGSMKSFYSGEPSKLAIETLEPTELRVIRKAELEMVYTHFKDFNVNGRMLTEKYYAMAEDYMVMKNEKPKQRYRQLLHAHPWMKDRITDGQMAAYLGINYVTFSNYKRGVR